MKKTIFNSIVPFLLTLGVLLFTISCKDSESSDGNDDTGEDSDTGSDTSSDTDSDSGLSLPYDFEEQAPWYECPTNPFPTAATVVTAFDQVYQYFVDEDDNKRIVESEVDFPDFSDWVQVGMWFNLDCPEGNLCDHWDRVGSIQLVINPEEEHKRWKYYELARHVTPYRIGMCKYIDVTPLASTLVGRQTLSSFIDTWVGPEHSEGEGWRVTVKFVFYPGEITNTSNEVINVWGRRQITVGEVEQGFNIDTQVDPVTLAIPSDATRVEAHLTTTGHSFGNTLNCAEFCQIRKDIIVNDTIYSINPWRDDCVENPVSPQGGTWQHNRNGWCPGSIVVGNSVDITESIIPGEDNTIDFNILLPDGSEYDNLSPVELLPYEIIALRLHVYK
ncbi:MAG: hypothetical protein GY847_25935 [Proteobacteria bacterium]|nr:hypothetical protein [Pseudomonadota bacterium]